jgi:hypothetical protein
VPAAHLAAQAALPTGPVIVGRSGHVTEYQAPNDEATWQQAALMHAGGAAVYGFDGGQWKDFAQLSRRPEGPVARFRFCERPAVRAVAGDAGTISIQSTASVVEYAHVMHLAASGARVGVRVGDGGWESVESLFSRPLLAGVRLTVAFSVSPENYGPVVEGLTNGDTNAALLDLTRRIVAARAGAGSAQAQPRGDRPVHAAERPDAAPAPKRQATGPQAPVEWREVVVQNRKGITARAFRSDHLPADLPPHFKLWVQLPGDYDRKMVWANHVKNGWMAPLCNLSAPYHLARPKNAYLDVRSRAELEAACRRQTDFDRRNPVTFLVQECEGPYERPAGPSWHAEIPEGGLAAAIARAAAAAPPRPESDAWPSYTTPYTETTRYEIAYLRRWGAQVEIRSTADGTVSTLEGGVPPAGSFASDVDVRFKLPGQAVDVQRVGDWTASFSAELDLAMLGQLAELDRWGRGAVRVVEDGGSENGARGLSHFDAPAFRVPDMPRVTVFVNLSDIAMDQLLKALAEPSHVQTARLVQSRPLDTGAPANARRAGLGLAGGRARPHRGGGRRAAGQTRSGEGGAGGQRRRPPRLTRRPQRRFFCQMATRISP